MIQFRQKKYSVWSDVSESALRGAGIGASVGTLGAGIYKFKGLKDTKIGKAAQDSPLIGVGTGILIGGALGALIGGIKGFEQAYLRKHANQRLFPDVLRVLKSQGFKEGTDFTQDPRKADLLGTRICLVVSRSSDNLKLLINMAQEPKLKGMSKEIIKNLPTSDTIYTQKATDRFNEISISTISSGGGDVGFIAGIAESFIRRGYPVQMIEVG